MQYKIAFEDMELNWLMKHPEENIKLENDVPTDFFNILGLDENASVDQIKEAYEALTELIEITPDYGGNKDYMLTSIKRTYDYLMDGELREHYRSIIKAKKEAHCGYTVYYRKSKRDTELLYKTKESLNKWKEGYFVAIFFTAIIVLILTLLVK